MCTGYTREIRIWVCEDTQNRRDEMLHAWSMACTQLIDVSEDTKRLQPHVFAINAEKNRFKQPDFFGA